MTSGASQGGEQHNDNIPARRMTQHYENNYSGGRHNTAASTLPCPWPCKTAVLFLRWYITSLGPGETPYSFDCSLARCKQQARPRHEILILPIQGVFSYFLAGDINKEPHKAQRVKKPGIMVLGVLHRCVIAVILLTMIRLPN